MVIALCDDLGYGDLGCYGHRYIKTPNIDVFAAEGMKFTDCYAAAPVCSPARAGMLTGRVPHRTGVYNWIPGKVEMHLPKDEITVARLLRGGGYSTCHVGKWHLNSYFNSARQPQPDDHGFDWWFSTQNNARPSHMDPVNFVRNGREVGQLKGHSSDLIVDEATDWLENHRDKDKPFCLFVWFHSPHEPVATHKKFTDMYKGRDEAIYYGNVTQTDYAFGWLMKTLDKMGLRDETFVMFTSDNGPETLLRYRSARNSYGSAGPLRGMKLDMWEGGIRVPGIIRWPGRVKAGSVSGEPVNGTDVLPSLCSMAGVKLPADRVIDGVNILPVFKGRKLERKIPMYWRFDKAPSKPFTVAMRDGDWKILADDKMTTFALYNLRRDIGEKHNLVDIEAQRFVQMKKKLMKLHAEIDAEGPKWPANWL
jgi:arylsulfatase A